MKQVKEARKEDAKARRYIYQSIDSWGFEKVVNARTTKRAWNVCVNTYKGAEKVKKVRMQTLRRQFELLQLKNQRTF